MDKKKWMHPSAAYKKTHLDIKDTHQLRANGWKTIFQSNGPKNQTGVAILKSEKIDIRQKLIKKRWRRTFYTHQKKNPPR